ncbi:MAG: phosphatidate cytidylyltransferase [Salinivirgaceae bacterium]|nr:phosphatidate cytidylyltransferase [Salinivirgaceae bacterium]
MSNFWQRLITGVVFLAVLISGIVYSQWTFAVLFAIIDVLALWEFYRIGRQSGYKPLAVYGTAAGLLSFILSFMSCAGLVDSRCLLLLVPVFIPVFIVVLFGRFDNPITTIAYTFYGLLYVALPFALISPIAFHAGSYQSIMVLGMFIIIWVNDTGAYCFGVTIGRHRMFERISPKKTWEGFFGGALAAVGASLILARFFPLLSQTHWIVVALLIVMFGTLGDLTESQLKRTVGIKDSSNILPGHGGILDRFDSIILAIPVIFAYLQIIA